MVMTPASGFEMPEAASRNVTFGPAATGGGTAAPGGEGAPPVCPGPRLAGAAEGPALAPGSSLSVSRRMSLMLSTRVSQNLLLCWFLTDTVDVFEFAPPAPPPPAPPPAAPLETMLPATLT